jgi:hypothetical protein
LIGLIDLKCAFGMAFGMAIGMAIDMAYVIMVYYAALGRLGENPGFRVSIRIGYLDRIGSIQASILTGSHP